MWMTHLRVIRRMLLVDCGKYGQ
ncbi:unnamed protein product [Ectocarpus sp. CCAP 1310/34]|nr:unnamed protein product [Ectocarpus sp. CCAP 1310/34]